MANSNHWQASLSEHRTAWIIACCCIATIFLASVWPDLFNFKSTSPAPESQSHIQQENRFTTPEKHTSRTIKKQPKQASKANRGSTAVAVKKNQTQTLEAEPKKVVAASGNYYVQAGAFKEKTLARKLASRINKHGWNAAIVPKSGLHAVWVGPKNSRSGIEKLQKSIHHTLNIRGFIVQKKLP